MENRLFSVPLGMAGRNSVPMEGIGSQINQNSLVPFESFHLNNHIQALDGYNLLQGAAPINVLHSSTRVGNPNSGAFVAKNIGRDTEFEEQFMTSAPFSGALTTQRNSLQDNVANFAVPEPETYPLEALRTYVSSEFADGLSSSFTSSVNYGSGEAFGSIIAKGESDRFAAPVRADLQPYMTIADHPYGSCIFSNELSLSLATSQRSAINGTNVSDQCSEISCSGVAPHRCFNESRLGSEQTSLRNKELSLNCSSYQNGRFSHLLRGSRYLQAVQEILADIASYIVETMEQICFSNVGFEMGQSAPFSSMYATKRGMRFNFPDETPTEDHGFDVRADTVLHRHALEAKKAQLLTLLQVVDDRYSQCVDEMHTVVSAFHAATELDPQMHTRFALQTISFLYKSLRERISNRIIAMGARGNVGAGGRGTRETEEGSDVTCYLQKQWTLQQFRKKDNQIWKPQRGLPEHSVSVLRAWMFQNFLHPYPKDAEKHLLAVRSGLTRSQVSNWFINARVRLWKPMIEEMYAEMNKRKGRQNEEGSSNNHRNEISLSNLRFSMN